MIYSRDNRMPPVKSSKSQHKQKQLSDVEEYDDEDYRKRRDRNNQAVKKSRSKTKQRTQETLDRVSKLKNENQVLEEKVKTLTKELGFLKELFLAHASNTQNPKFDGVDINSLLKEEPENIVKSEKDED